MTREKEILNEIYYQNHLADIDAESFIRGAEWADRNPKSLWTSTKDKLPPEGEEVLAFNKKWINKDFNPKGIRIGFLNGDKEFTSAYWWDYQDGYLTINKSICENDKDFYVNHIDNTEPEYWIPLPELPETPKSVIQLL